MKTLPTLDSHENIMKAVAELKEKPAVLVSEYGHIAGILTKYDVLDFV